MDADAADKLRFAEAEMAPAATGIGRFVDAVAPGDVEPDLGLPGAGINHVGVGACHLERTDRRRAEKPVTDAAPIDPAIDRLPHAAGAGAEIKHPAISGVAGNGDDAATAWRPDAAPF